ncbi:MAG: ATP-binding protein [Anaerolineae bacterium]|nr:ATP-binding protein [Anaerolineae bacterium]
MSNSTQSYSVIIRGPLGVGKTTIARALAQRLGAMYVSVDTVMTENGLDIVEGEYIPVENFVKVNELVLPQAADALNEGMPVVFDGNFYYERQITHLLETVQGPHYVFTLHAPLDVCIARDAQRALVYGEDAAAAVYGAVSRVDYGTRIETADKTVEDVLQELIRLLPSTGVAGERR